MKKIIDGRLYDTESALKLGDSGRIGEGFYAFSESLYVTGRGQYFLYGCGGPRTHYAVHEEGSNTISSGVDIVLLEEGEAMVWGAKHMSVEEYVSAFGEVEVG